MPPELARRWFFVFNTADCEATFVPVVRVCLRPATAAEKNE
jgi:hypothetical protein